VSELEGQRRPARKIEALERANPSQKLQRAQRLGGRGLRVEAHHPQAFASRAQSGASNSSTRRISLHRAKERRVRSLERGDWSEVNWL